MGEWLEQLPRVKEGTMPRTIDPSAVPHYEEDEETKDLSTSLLNQTMDIANEQGFGCFGCGGDLSREDFQLAHDDNVGHEVVVCSDCARDYPTDDETVVVSGPYVVHEHGSLEAWFG